MNPTLVLVFGIGVLLLLIALSYIGVEMLRELLEIRSVLESLEGKLVEISPKSPVQ